MHLLMKFKKLEIISFLLPLIFVFILMTRAINAPYVGPNATDLNVFSLVAKNYDKFGYLNIKFAPIVGLSKDIPQKPDVYLHHPIFTELIESTLFKIFGFAFWVGRMTLIIPSFLILPLFFLIGKEIKNKKLGMIALIVGCLIPATIVFGRQSYFAGSWNLFFVVLASFLALKYLKTNRNKFFILCLIAVTLGTLSDWPMTYFTPFLIPLFIKNKKAKQGIIIVLTSTLTAVLFLTYSYFILGSLQNIIDAILNRSTGELLGLSFWPIRWISVLLIRFVLYFNPLFFLLSIVYIYFFIKKLLKKTLDNFDLLIFAFLGYGITNILLYPEGSFGHPFWVYLLVPFLVFSCARLINERVKKVNWLVVILFILSILFVLRIEDWKTQQILSNTFRYNLAKAVSSYLIPYDTIDINPSSYIDTDIYRYSFYQNVRYVYLPLKSFNDLKNANYYIYACINCNLNSPDINYLAQNFKYKSFNSPPGTVYIFFLKQKQTETIPKPLINKAVNIPVGVVPQKQSVLRKVYNFLVDFLHAPQL